MRVVASGMTRHTSRERPATAAKASRKAETSTSRELTFACWSPGSSAPSTNFWAETASSDCAPSPARPAITRSVVISQATRGRGMWSEGISLEFQVSVSSLKFRVSSFQFRVRNRWYHPERSDQRERSRSTPVVANSRLFQATLDDTGKKLIAKS